MCDMRVSYRIQYVVCIDYKQLSEYVFLLYTDCTHNQEHNVHTNSTSFSQLPEYTMHGLHAP